MLVTWDSRVTVFSLIWIGKTGLQGDKEMMKQLHISGKVGLGAQGYQGSISLLFSEFFLSDAFMLRQALSRKQK